MQIVDSYFPVIKELQQRTGIRYIILMGGRGAGRSYFASQVIYNMLKSQDYFRCAIMRFVLGDIRNSTFQEVLDRIDEENQNYRFLVKENTLEIEYGNSFVKGIGFRKSSGDQKSKLKSLAGFNYIDIEEADEIAEEDFMQLDDSLRTIKSDITVVLRLNPPDKNHWIIKRWFNLIPSEIDGFYIPVLKDSEKEKVLYIHNTYIHNEKNINQSTRDNYEKYKETRPDYYYNMIRGLVSDGVRGRIFKNFSVISKEEYEKLEYIPYYGQDYGFSCLDGDTLIKTNNGERKIRELKKGDLVYTRKGYKKITSHKNTGVKKVYGLNFGYGKNIITEDHRVFTSDGWKKVKDLDKQETICLSQQGIIKETPALLDVQINLQLLKEEREVFDISVGGESEFFANGLLVHNCDPTALIEIKKHNNKVYLKELIYETGLTNKRICERYEQLGLSRLAEIYADSSEPKSIEEQRELNWNVMPAVKGQGSVMAGIDMMLDLEIYITEDSVNLLREFQNYTWALDRNKEPINQPVDKENHGIDASKYGIYSKSKQGFIGFV